ncbi:MAG TPA: hypothetical protein VHZ33_36030 [Trebonia sp.]|jgi:hypothetical protein|nr:hypothetical protein [Trebonia sp.]
MWHHFPPPKLSIVRGSAKFQGWRAEVPMSAAAHWRLMVFLFFMAAWGLYEEDSDDWIPPLEGDRQLFQCPRCNRQKVASFEADLDCEGRLIHRHPKEAMVPVGRNN